MHIFNTRAHNAKQCKHAKVRQPLSALSTDCSAVIVGIIVVTTSTATATAIIYSFIYLFIVVVIIISVRYFVINKAVEPVVGITKKKTRVRFEFMYF
jgi:hypothetical protein